MNALHLVSCVSAKHSILHTPVIPAKAGIQSVLYRLKRHGYNSDIGGSNSAFSVDIQIAARRYFVKDSKKDEPTVEEYVRALLWVISAGLLITAGVCGVSMML